MERKGKNYSWQFKTTAVVTICEYFINRFFEALWLLIKTRESKTCWPGCGQWGTSIPNLKLKSKTKKIRNHNYTQNLFWLVYVLFSISKKYSPLKVTKGKMLSILQHAPHFMGKQEQTHKFIKIFLALIGPSFKCLYQRRPRNIATVENWYIEASDEVS